MMKTLLIGFVLVAAPMVAQAQLITTGPVPVGARLQYDAPTNVTTVADAQSFEARLSDGGTPLTAATTASGLSCATVSAVITCQWTLTQSNLDALNRVGTHVLTVKLYRADVGESPASNPFTLSTTAGAPTGLRIIR